MKFPNGARLQALGETAAATSEGSEAIFWNPAGLARAAAESPSELSLGYSNMLETSYVGSAAYLRPTASGAFGAGLLYYSQSAQTAYTLQGDSAGTFHPYDFAGTLSYALRYGSLLFGAGAKLIHSSLGATSGSAFAVDLGAQALHVADVGEGPVDVGLSAMNLGSALKLGSTSDPLPFLIRGGFLWHTAPYLSAAMDANMPVDGDPYISLGVEATTRLGAERRWKAALRAGYNQRYTRGNTGLTGMTAGAGLDMERVRLDYAWAPYGDLGSTNLVTLAFRF